jgi:hypothetical protein
MKKLDFCNLNTVSHPLTPPHLILMAKITDSHQSASGKYFTQILADIFYSAPISIVPQLQFAFIFKGTEYTFFKLLTEYLNSFVIMHSLYRQDINNVHHVQVHHMNATLQGGLFDIIFKDI